jgi:glyceraldehyde 3-phosphate dehydrogenase
MSLRVAINGFGRIGRNAFKVAFGHLDGLDIVAVNDLTDPATLAHLLRHDTNYGAYDREVRHDDQHVIVDGTKIRVYAEKDPAKLPWKDERIDVVLECTGRFTDEAGASAHLTAGAKRVIISAPAKGGNVPTMVLGVNGEQYDGAAKVLNNASCTTNCIAPVAAVIHAAFGIKKAMMTTTHAYTADQNLQDGPHRDLRRARAAAADIVPTTTGAAIATTEVIPELVGMFDGLSVRVPVSVVSLADFTFVLARSATVEQVNDALREAATSPRYRGVLGVTDEELVSSDFIKNPHSAIVDLPLTRVVDGDLLKVVAWYDNEWGYANRLVEMALVAGHSA